MTKQSAQPITERDLARKLTETFGVREWKPVIDIIKEVTGREFAPEPKPLPTEPGSVIIATEVRGVEGEWRAFLCPDGYWVTPEDVGGSFWHRPEQVTAWTPARVVPATAAPVALTEDQVGEVWDAVTSSDPEASLWVDYSSSHRARLKATVNAILAQHATPAEVITAYLAASQPVVETVEELEELPVGTVVFCAKDYPLWLNRRTVQGWWYRPGDEEDFSDDEIPLPARVIWRPHESA